MLCELDKTEGKTCILQSPLIPDTFDWTCLYLKYELSSDDVKMTLDLLADNEPIESHTLLANLKKFAIPNPDLESISFQLTASRYLASAEDYEYAAVYEVSFMPCSINTGEFLCLKPNVIYTVNHKKRNILFLTITLANLNRFLQFLYHFNREEILHATVIKFIASPDLCAHLTWKPTFLLWF